MPGQNRRGSVVRDTIRPVASRTMLTVVPSSYVVPTCRFAASYANCISANRTVFPRASYTISDAPTPSVTLDAPGIAPVTVEDNNRSAQS
jgi:hypothetical protein